MATDTFLCDKKTTKSAVERQAAQKEPKKVNLYSFKSIEVFSNLGKRLKTVPPAAALLDQVPPRREYLLNNNLGAWKEINLNQKILLAKTCLDTAENEASKISMRGSSMASNTSGSTGFGGRCSPGTIASSKSARRFTSA